MERVPFDVIFFKDGQRLAPERIEVPEFNDLRRVDHEWDPEFSSPEATYTNEALAKNDLDRVRHIESVKSAVFEKAEKLFGTDLAGIDVEIRPNFHSLIDTEKIVKQYVEFVKEFEPGLDTKPEKVAALRLEAKQAVDHYKSMHAQYFPGMDDKGINEAPNPVIKEEVEHRIQHHNTIDVVNTARADINETLHGNNFMKSRGGEHYFIILQKPGEADKITSAQIEDSLTMPEKKEALKLEAQKFAIGNVKNKGQLEGAEIRIEKANGLTDPQQHRYYQAIGQTAEKTLNRGLEIER